MTEEIVQGGPDTSASRQGRDRHFWPGRMQSPRAPAASTGFRAVLHPACSIAGAGGARCCRRTSIRSASGRRCVAGNSPQGSRIRSRHARNRLLDCITERAAAGLCGDETRGRARGRVEERVLRMEVAKRRRLRCPTDPNAKALAAGSKAAATSSVHDGTQSASSVPTHQMLVAVRQTDHVARAGPQRTSLSPTPNRCRTQRCENDQPHRRPDRNNAHARRRDSEDRLGNWIGRRSSVEPEFLEGGVQRPTAVW